MTLAKTRIEILGDAPSEGEREAIEFIIGQLPSLDPYLLWGEVDLHDPSTGRLYEIGALVLGYSALFVIEIVSAPGLYEGDAEGWKHTPPGQPVRHVAAPYAVASQKAKALTSRLRLKMQDPPPVQPLGFLSSAEARIDLRDEGRVGVVLRNEVARALTRGKFWGSGSRDLPPINWTQQRGVVEALRAAGLKARAGKMMVGSWELGALLGEGPGYQDREAISRERASYRRRARIYLVPQQTSVERRQQLQRAAQREADLLYDLRSHPSILAFTGDLASDAPLGPTIFFDAFEGGLRLDAYLRIYGDLGFSDRVDILAQVGRALEYCHRRGVKHGAVSPESVLVRRQLDGGTSNVEVKLYNFQLGWTTEVTGTVHRSSLVSEASAVYLAPELREDPTSGKAYSDVFGLGALAYFTLTGRPPAGSVAEVEARLERDGCLDPRAVDDTLRDKVAEAVRDATYRSIGSRDFDVGAWVEKLLAATVDAEAEAPPEVSPLEAAPGDALREFQVVRVLGHGASSRVLEVERDGRLFALKVSLSEDHDARLLAEAGTLERLRHPRIVELVETPTLGGRTCLLLSLAGETTLYARLVAEGSVSLDSAARYGDDLLSALELLEEMHVSHRDIKPANLGVGSASGRKEANHLTLFDFSLIDAPAGDITTGTAAYRDPFLRERGAWDAHADLWSAAVTLHEMLTGVRPRLRDTAGAGAGAGAGVGAGAAAGAGTGTGTGSSGPVVLAAERFAPGVRETLTAFFAKALARATADRFASASEMRRAWQRALEAGEPGGVGAKVRARASTERPPVTSAELARMTPETPIEALPLSSLAKNALDRAGLTQAAHLLRLPDNRLSAIRGIGATVSGEVLELRDKWKQHHAVSEALSPAAFFPGFRGDDAPVEGAGVDAALASVLVDAGLTTLGSVAAAAEAQVRVLVTRVKGDEAALRKVLERAVVAASEREHPTTIEGWVEALLPAKKKSERHVRALYGLEAPFVGNPDIKIKQVAEHLGVTQPAIYQALTKAHEGWKKHPARADLLELCRRLLEDAGGALPLTRAAEALCGAVPSDQSSSPEGVRAAASALWRIAVKLESESQSGLTLARTASGDPWVFSSADLIEPVRRLGDAADGLAARPVLASPGEAHRLLLEQVQSTPLANAPLERLTETAALASKTAARSTRLELYPKGLTAERALELTANVITGGVTPGEIRQRVLARYPQAADLPERPELDRLAEKLGLHWDEPAQKYQRPPAAESTSLHSSVLEERPLPNARPSQRKADDKEAYTARDFDDRLASALEMRGLRVLPVKADMVWQATQKLSERLGTKAVELDKALIEEIERLMREKKVQAEAVEKADREGPEGPTWRNLAMLAKLAADALAKKLFPPSKPLLLVQPGLLSRYDLQGFLQTMVETSKRDDAAAIFLLVPAHDVGGMPAINGKLSIPGVLPSKALWVSTEWVHNKHNAAAT